MTQLRLLIISNDPLARAGLSALLAGQPDCAVVGQTGSQLDLSEAIDLYQPDIILWDLGWEPATALEQVGDLQDLQIPAVLLLPTPSAAPEAWGAGARGLLLRQAGAEQLMAALQTVAQGLIALDPEIIDTLLPNPQLTPPTLAEALTPREMEVLQLLAEGLPNKSIAQRLEISEHTVKFHVNAIMGKLNAQSRTEAVVRATQLGLILL